MPSPGRARTDPCRLPQPAHLAPAGSAVGSSASAPVRTRPATPPRGPACAPQATTAPAASNVSTARAALRVRRSDGRGGLWEPPDPGSWPLAPQGARLGASGPAVSCSVGVSTGAPVTRPPGPAAAPPGSLGPTAASVSGWGVSLHLDRQGPAIWPAGQTAPDRATPWVPRWDWSQTRLSWGDWRGQNVSSACSAWPCAMPLTWAVSTRSPAEASQRPAERRDSP